MFFVTFPSNVVKRIKGRRVLACKFFPSLFLLRKNKRVTRVRVREKEKRERGRAFDDEWRLRYQRCVATIKYRVLR